MANEVLILDTSKPEGQAALMRWAHIPDAERAKWGKPYVFECPEMIAYYRARGVGEAILAGGM